MGSIRGLGGNLDLRVCGFSSKALNHDTLNILDL